MMEPSGRIGRTEAVGMAASPSWTPSAPQAAATSALSFTRRMADPRVTSRNAAASSSSAPPDSSLSRSWTISTPPATAAATRPGNSSGGQTRRSVTRQRAGFGRATPIE